MPSGGDFIKTSGYSSLNYPTILKKLYMPECIEYRKKFNERMHAYLNRRISRSDSSEKTYFQDLSKEQNLIVPHDVVLNILGNPFDIISISGLKDNSPFFFLEHHVSNNSVKEGIGKTAIMLKLLGIEIPYNEIPNTAEEVLQSDMKRISFENREIKLISSDMFFTGINKGLLAFGPMKGEQMESQWDLARHIFRVKDPDYKPGKHREPASRTYLEALGATHYLDSNIFADTKKSYAVDSMFLIERKKNPKNNIVIKEASFQKRLEKIEKTLMGNPCYHHSPFWEIDKKEHVKRVKNIMKDLDAKRIPEVYNVFIPPYVNRQREEEIIEKTAEKILQAL
jgi:hypothetical protein